MDNVKKGYLVLTRRVDQAIFIGDEIEIFVTSIKGGTTVQLGIRAPRHLKIIRSEIADKVQKEGAKNAEKV